MLRNLQILNVLNKGGFDSRVAFFSVTSIFKQEKIKEPIEWKRNVVQMPIQTTPDDLKKSHKLLKDGFYVSHRIYVEEMPEKYSTEPVKTRRTGGYDVETRERLFKRVGGGLPIDWYFVDFKRVGPKSGAPLVEKVIDIFKTRDRTAFLALVAHADSKRLILATQNLKVGDLIRTSGEIPRVAVKANECDAYPLAALPIGTLVHCVEQFPGHGGVYCKAAGSSAEIMNQVDDRVIVRLPSNLELSLDRNCMATVGQVSHATHKDEKLSHPVDRRDLGYRPRSGLWHKKDGYCGRKIHPAKPVKVIKPRDEMPTPSYEKIKYTFNNWSLTE